MVPLGEGETHGTIRLTAETRDRKTRAFRMIIREGANVPGPAQPSFMSRKSTMADPPP